MSQDAVELAKKEVRGCAVLGKSHEPCSTTAHILARALLAERERAERWKALAEKVVEDASWVQRPYKGGRNGTSQDEYLNDLKDSVDALEAALAAEQEGACAYVDCRPGCDGKHETLGPHTEKEGA